MNLIDLSTFIFQLNLGTCNSIRDLKLEPDGDAHERWNPDERSLPRWCHAPQSTCFVYELHNG